MPFTIYNVHQAGRMTVIIARRSSASFEFRDAKAQWASTGGVGFFSLSHFGDVTPLQN